MSIESVNPEDEEAGAVVRAVARQLKLWREAAGLTQSEFGAAIGYGEELVSSVERGRRIPRPEYLDAADKVLGANGKIAAMKQDLAEVRYPKKVRDVRRLEIEAVQICSYNNSIVDGLLQTEAYARAVFGSRRPPYTEEGLERQLAARLARQEILTGARAKPLFSFVLCEATLRRSIGGRMVMRAQLERLLEVAQLPNVDLQVLPLDSEENSGLSGPFRLLKLKDGSTVGLSEAPLISRVLCDPKETTVLDVRYGIIRAQALTPRESVTFIEQLRGET
ncbi:transcriptional regulator [Streptomyces thermoviolaceus subsp. thermoviolaceus]|uniref:Helix-turn-helix domain-containing protein n=1 Tax=Streptomyces thermoviolaceus subsp. thermoviolaceus TaxID=66860 RepID=A0ABX0YRB9_STRTL|nr:helix-turn-helix transcriptional regulator [Streptomyces thermoviolaceus]NJP14934.1 helix-turn-helix domain-containing protein [Streptomyces thermoviolaceus subsp. thermoviolaceus]GHB01522.1 transcriptional regulator [Streptomyces thermoviolaceus subsp. thermoviolaceus]